MKMPSQTTEAEPPPVPRNDGDTEMKDSPKEAPPAASESAPAMAPPTSAAPIHPQVPPLGRGASLGDTQPKLAERQISVDASPARPVAPAPMAMAMAPTGATPPPPSAATMPSMNGNPPSPVQPTQPPSAAAAGKQAAPPAAPTPAPVVAAPSPPPPRVAATPPNIAQHGLPIGANVPPIPMAAPRASPPTAAAAPRAHPSIPPMPPQSFVEKAPVAAPAPAQRPPGPPGLGFSPASHPSAGAAAAAAAAAAPGPISGMDHSPAPRPPPQAPAPMPYAAAASASSGSFPPTGMPPASMAARMPQHAAAAAVQTPPRHSPPQAPPQPVAPPAPPVRAAAPPPAAVASRPPAAVPGMRELRVEDALLYLDDVKREFGDRPRVYNEFLAIMKNFKSQEVDTPGVIARVSKLFRGYNNLILGFNKFLPDGYKISYADLEAMDAAYAVEQEELRRQSLEFSEFPPEVPPRQQGLGQGGMGQLAPAGMPPAAGFPSQAPLRAPGGPPGLGPPPGTAMAAAAMPSSAEGRRRDLVESNNHPSLPPQMGKSATESAAPAGKPYPSGRKRATPRAAPAPAPRPPPAREIPPPAAAPAPAPQQAVEFDHAISYVTTIKRRFADDPSTYHSFLEILHTYQKEQRGIKEVLEQVAHLFQDHPDLLKEFTFFLPDAVQEQAKERLHRAAADSEARMAAAQRAQLEAQSRAAGGGQEDMDVDPQNGSHRLMDMTAAGQPRPDVDKSRGGAGSGSGGRKRSHKEAAAATAAATTEAAPQQPQPPPPIVLPQQPETYVYNSAVERQFFDTAREALAAYTRDGGQAWAEFLKCLDMYAQEILSRSEMFNFVEPLLGKRNNKLFEEFKRIINHAGAQAVNNAPNVEDSWYSVPLSEIDFSRCRRCSPSYRALPRDYPSPPCSDRSEEESKILNDVWVSLPVGSEESYTFRHMRRNTYEEILFRCEDERFEIDMAIDSNTATLARLEPIAEEIAQLAENELVLPETSTTPKPASIDQGMGGKRYHYTFDKTILGVIHRNSISRLYGDAGLEMLDLIVKNPTVAVPLVVERLRQKDTEWRKVRSRLNKRWKELAEHNYYRSLDHRSLTWRTTDKRSISTRTLVSEIKDRASHGGNEGAASWQVRLDKAKEEHGGFYEVTMGQKLKKELDLTNLPKPDRRLFTPHMSLMYENTDWAHQDAYRILSFALERGSISPSDKERCHRLWFDFLGPWFNLSMDWMMTPAVNFQETTKPEVGTTTTSIPRVVSNGGDDSMGDDDDEDSAEEDEEIAARVVTEDVRQMKPNDKHDSPSYMDHHPLPAGATVSTLYGDGRIIKCRRSDDTYMVQLAFGTAYLRPSAVLCSIIPAEKSAYTTQLRSEDRTKLEHPNDMLALGTQSLYLFFRLHQILVRRLGIAKKLAYAVKDDPTLINMVEQMPGEDAAALGRRRYDAYLSLVFALLDGGQNLAGSAAEGGKYEDRVRALLGHGGYELATMDKLLSHILKNLQSMANDDTMWNLVQLYRRHLALGSFKPEAFRMEAGYLSDGEQMYAFQMCPVQKDTKGGDNDKSVLHMEYLGVLSDSDRRPDALTGAANSNHHVVEQNAPIAKRQKR